MPFDSLPTNDTVTLNLIRAREAIERGWCQGAFHTDGGYVCVVGAIGKALGVRQLDLLCMLEAPELDLLWAALPLKDTYRPSAVPALTSYNDQNETTLPDVLKLYDNAIALSKL